MKKVLFDLDGTLINSEEGVTKCVQYALQSVGIDEPDLSKLRVFIGPPLALMYNQLYGFDKEACEALVDKYRERYNVHGIHECEVYPGVEELLKHLNEKGYMVAVASSKPETACEEILRNHQLDHYFTHIVGATLDASRREKSLVLQEAFRRMEIQDLSEVVLIGDTKYDVNGAKKVGIDCIGITYGFGSREELKEAGAVAVFDDLREVEAYLETI